MVALCVALDRQRLSADVDAGGAVNRRVSVNVEAGDLGVAVEVAFVAAVDAEVVVDGVVG